MRKAVAFGAGGAALAGAAALFVPPSARESGTEPVASVTTVLPDGRVRRRVELVARDVDLSHPGIHTHANWVVFELPFDTTSGDVRAVRFFPRTTVRSDVGALLTPIGCLRTPSIGPVQSGVWTKLTRGAVGGTLHLWEHELVPTKSSRDYAINVPSRVANAAACWLPALARNDTWRLVVEWEAPR